MAEQVYQAKHGFATYDPAGNRVHIRPGDTVSAGHWLLETSGAAFERIKVKFPGPERVREPAPTPPSPPAGETKPKRTA